MHRFLSLLFLISLLVAPACTPATPAVEPTLATTLTSTPRPSATPTSTATPTLIPSPTPPNTPTPTFTPRPTATPVGYNNFPSLGFWFLKPRGWEIAEEADSYVAIVDSASQVVMLLLSGPESEEMPLEDVNSEMVAQFFPNGASGTAKKGEVTLADGQVAGTMTQDGNTQNGKLRLQTIYKHIANRAYIFVALAPPDTFSDAAIAGLLSDFHLYLPEFAGLEQSQTLAQIGGDPDPEDLDPSVTLGAAGSYVGLMFSGLVRLTPQLQIVPDLAESWDLSPDGLTFTFHLRTGIQFASGTPITAQDVKDSWERTADPTLQSSTARTYLGDIRGFQDKLDGKADAIEGVRVVDERTLEVTLDGPKPYFLAKLTYPTAFVFDPSQAQPKPRDWVFTASSSGPYQIRDYRQDESIIFERNPNYHTQPAIPYLVYIFFPGGSPLSLYKDGLIDILPVGSDNALQIRRPEDPLHSDLQSGTSLCTNMLMFNNALPPFDDVQVRQAFAMAVDNTTLAERLAKGSLLPATAILPPAMPGFSQDIRASGFDPAAAKEALAASTYAGDLPPVTLNVSGLADSDRDDVSALLEMWRANLGVDVQVEYLDPQDFVKAARSEHDQMVLFGWCADYPDPENFLDVLFHTGNEMNVSGYSNEEVDALLEAARVEVDPQVRLQQYQQAESMLLADAAAAPLYYSVQDVLVKPRVAGYVLSPLHSLAEIWLSFK